MFRKPYNRGNTTGRQRYWYQLRYDPPDGTDAETEFKRILLWMKKHDHPSLYSAWDGHTLWRGPDNYLRIRVEDQGCAGLIRILFAGISV